MAATAAPALDLERLDAAVERAIAEGSPRGLRVLGFGEITLVLGWPTDAPRLAVKRLPPFPDAARTDAYEDVLRAWTRALERAGVRVMDTAVARAAGPGGTVHAYLVQPLADRDRLLNRVLRRADRRAGAALLDRLAEVICAAVDEHVGLDAQAANWLVQDGDLVCLDVSTPMLRDDTGGDRLDLALFLSAYPWALRALLAPIAHTVLAQYHDARGVLLDTASNLHKERLDPWVPVLLDAGARRLTRPIGIDEVRRYFARDKALWLTMQRLRRADRLWQRHVRRRPYPFLLPPPYRYGPPPEGGTP